MTLGRQSIDVRRVEYCKVMTIDQSCQTKIRNVRRIKRSHQNHRYFGIERICQEGRYVRREEQSRQEDRVDMS